MWGVTSITDDGVVHLVCSSSLPFSKLATSVSYCALSYNRTHNICVF
jgi:hypothetical protein